MATKGDRIEAQEDKNLLYHRSYIQEAHSMPCRATGRHPRVVRRQKAGNRGKLRLGQGKQLRIG